MGKTLFFITMHPLYCSSSANIQSFGNENGGGSTVRHKTTKQLINILLEIFVNFQKYAIPFFIIIMSR